MVPRTLHGLTALVYGLIGGTTRATLPAAIEVLADLPDLGGKGLGGLPLAELATFGFEMLIGRAFEQGWQDVFATSDAYAAYAAQRQAAGLP
jgi:hypothetical protein